MATNLTGPFLCCRAVVPVMIARHYGKITTCPPGADGTVRREGPPIAPERQHHHFTECLGAEVKEHGIDVNAICPGAVVTDIMSQITDGNVPSYAMPPEDIASVVVFLASAESRAVTGTAIDVSARVIRCSAGRATSRRDRSRQVAAKTTGARRASTSRVNYPKRGLLSMKGLLVLDTTHGNTRAVAQAISVSWRLPEFPWIPCT